MINSTVVIFSRSPCLLLLFPLNMEAQQPASQFALGCVVASCVFPTRNSIGEPQARSGVFKLGSASLLEYTGCVLRSCVGKGFLIWPSPLLVQSRLVKAQIYRCVRQCIRTNHKEIILGSEAS